jgi:probable HAF family extracellular repeat protein
VKKAVMLGVFVSAGSVAAASPTFRSIGDLPGGAFFSRAMAVSADGRVVVGEAEVSSGVALAVRWVDGRLESLGDLSGGNIESVALGVSPDGSVVVGQGSGSAGPEAFRWAGGVMQGLGGLGDPVFFGSTAYAASSGGVVIAGIREGEVTIYEACRWRTGSIEGLGYLGGSAASSVSLAITPDASVIVGNSESARGVEAFRWQDGVMVALGDLNEGAPFANSSANAVTPDGQTIVGYGAVGNGQSLRAVRWVGGVIQDLGELPGGPELGSALGVSASGRVVVGYGTVAGGATEAFIWTPQRGMISLKSYLVNTLGIAGVSGWTLSVATGISADGTVICGYGRNTAGATEGFVATIPAECGADFNADGFIDFFDYDDFFVAFETAGQGSDFNGDGFLDFFDVDDFSAAFERGC